MNEFSLDFYDYPLPGRLIAKHPARPRDNSRLLACDPARAAIQHHKFKDIVSLVPSGAVVVLNDTRVVAARIFVKSEKGAAHECVVTRVIGNDRVEGLRALIKNRKRLKAGSRVRIPDEMIELIYEGPDPDDAELSMLKLTDAVTPDAWGKLLARVGQMPIPPYIDRPYDPARDPADYQTVFARDGHSVAAPTAGLHFSDDTLAALRARDIAVHTITLDVGYGTFQPIRADDIRTHRIHSERFKISRATWTAIETAPAVVAVGTTSLRAIEAFARLNPRLFDTWINTDLYVYPGFEFTKVTHLLTNFHLPKSSLLCLVYAFGGTEFVRRAYQEAVAGEYRFYSYGDAMLVARGGRA